MQNKVEEDGETDREKSQGDIERGGREEKNQGDRLREETQECVSLHQMIPLHFNCKLLHLKKT